MAGIRSGVSFVGRGSVWGGGGGLRLGREAGFTIHYPPAPGYVATVDSNVAVQAGVVTQDVDFALEPEVP